MSSPEQIRAEIARTRAELSDDVNSLTYEANPKTMARRQMGKIRSAITGVKGKVMGLNDEGTSAPGSAGVPAGDRLTDTTSTVSEKVSEAPEAIRSQTQGSPLAAGLIAFGVGALIGGLLPASAPEQQAAQKVKEATEPLAEELKDAAKETAEALQEPAQHAVESVKDTAATAADTVKDEGISAAQEVKGHAQESAQNIQDSRS